MEQLQQYLLSLQVDRLCLAYSGGVDSTLILKACVDLGIAVHAVTFETFLHPHGDLAEAKTLAEQLGATHQTIAIDELSDKRILTNPKERCYYCKHLLFTTLKQVAKEQQLSVILDGTNADDLKEYRPGLQALKELGIVSPLAACNFSKAQVRALSAQLGLVTASRPAAPCLATRLPYGTTITKDLLNRIDLGEQFLKQWDLYNVRLRCHDTVARIEVDDKDIPLLVSHRNAVVEGLRKLGFTHITIDLAGFQTGSYDKALQ